MGISAVGSVPDFSDATRLALVTSTPTAANSGGGRGAAYDPTELAAGRLVHVHRASDHRFLVAFDKTWTNATPSQADPGAYSTYTVNARPMTYWIDSSGNRVPCITGPGGVPGQVYPNQAVKLLGGASHGPMVYFLGTLSGFGLVLTYRADLGICSLVASSWLANAQPEGQAEVVWNKGILASGGYLYVVGEQTADHRLFMLKLPLSTARSVPFYLGGGGWTPNPRELAPLLDQSGAPMTSLGPVSLARYQQEWYLTTTAKAGAETVVRFSRARNPRGGWRPVGSQLSLTTVAGNEDTTAYFQQAVLANPDHPELSGDNVAGLPYSYTIDNGGSALRTAWGVLGIPRQRL